MKKLALAVAFTSTAISTAATAGPWELEYWDNGSGAGGASLYLYGDSGGTWLGNPITATLSPDGHSINFDDSSIRATGWVSGVTWLSDITMDNWVIDNNLDSSGTFTCTEGAFGGTVGASICGDYNFGSGKAGNESSYNSTTGITTIGGNDVSLGEHISGNDYWGQSINDLAFMPWYAASGSGAWGIDFFALTSRTINSTTFQLEGAGSTLYFTNTSDCIPPEEGDAWTCPPNPAFVYAPSASPVPLPAAAWLFGSALIGLAGARIRKK